MIQVVHDGIDDLPQVVGGDVGGHAHGDAARPVHQQVGEPRGEDRRLLLVPVVVADEVDGLGLDVAEDLQGDGGKPRFGVPHGGWRIPVDRTEVAVRVDQRVAEREVLGHPDEGLVDRVEPVRVVLLDHLADRPRRLAVWAVRPQARLEHRPQDPSVHGLQAVADVGQRPAHDDRHRVVQVGALDLLLDLDGLDPAVEEGHGPPAASTGSPRHPGSAPAWRWLR